MNTRCAPQINACAHLNEHSHEIVDERRVLRRRAEVLADAVDEEGRHLADVGLLDGGLQQEESTYLADVGLQIAA